jgi:hypothetical protein
LRFEFIEVGLARQYRPASPPFNDSER